jgi:hypothetical protein
MFGEEDAQKFGVDLERVLLKYNFNDHLRMSFGHYHTGIGYYNTAFHLAVAGFKPRRTAR